MDKKKFLGMDEEEFDSAMDSFKHLLESVKGSMDLTHKMGELLDDQPLPAVFTALQYSIIKTIYDMTDHEQAALAYAARFNKLLVSGIESLYDSAEEDGDAHEDESLQ